LALNIEREKMLQGRLDYILETEQALALEKEKVEELRETVALLRRALARAEEKIRLSPFVQ
tara:strand:- start:485 stop:667 length:183 start_codon:yes stop_codon:yes gene_type:complete